MKRSSSMTATFALRGADGCMGSFLARKLSKSRATRCGAFLTRPLRLTGVYTTPARDSAIHGHERPIIPPWGDPEGERGGEMPKDFNLGLVFLSYLVAVTASHVTLLLAARVRDPRAVRPAAHRAFLDIRDRRLRCGVHRPAPAHRQAPRVPAAGRADRHRNRLDALHRRPVDAPVPGDPLRPAALRRFGPDRHRGGHRRAVDRVPPRP